MNFAISLLAFITIPVFIMAELDEFDVYKKTIYAEARGEPKEGQIGVAWVIKTRAAKNKEYWGGNTIKGVCLKPGQFECWNGKTDIQIDDKAAFDGIDGWLHEVQDGKIPDNTQGSDHYNNPDKEGFPEWTKNCDKTVKIGNHQFYKQKE